MFYVSEQGQAEIRWWSRDVVAKGNGMIVEGSVFYHFMEHTYPQYRINSITMNGLTVTVGGGPESHVDFPNLGAPNGYIDPDDLDVAIQTLLARLQKGAAIAANYPDAVDDEDKPFSW